MASEGAQQAVSNLSTELEHLPERVSLVPSLITSLVDEQPIPMSSDAACRIRKLRHDTGNAAVAYIKCVLPLEQLCISDIKGFFEHYQYLAMDEWWKRIKSITQEVKEHREVCDTLLAVHEYLMAEVKQQEDNAIEFMNERKYLVDQLEREATKFRNQGRAAVGAGSVLSGALPFLVSPIGAVVAGVVIATSSLLAAKTKMDQSSEKGKEANKESAAVAVIGKTVIPVLSEFISALNCMSRLFAFLQNELETIQEKGEKAMEEEEPKYLHYKVMKEKAKRIIDSCTNSSAIMHSNDSKVDAILATKKLDIDYVDKSLLEVKKVISNNCTNGKVIDKMMKALSNRDKVTDGDEPINGDRNQNELSKELRALVFLVFIAFFAYFLVELLCLAFFVVIVLCEMEKGELPKELHAVVTIILIALLAFFPIELLSLTLLAAFGLQEMDKGDVTRALLSLISFLFIVLLAYFPNTLLVLILCGFVALWEMDKDEFVKVILELIVFGFIAPFAYFPKMLFTVTFLAFIALWKMKL